MATHPPDVVPTVEKRPKRPREDDTADDGNALKCPWCAKNIQRTRGLRKHMLQKHPEKQLSRGGEEAQDALVSDGEAEQEEQQQTEFVCQQCHRVLKSKTWLTRHKCEPTSIINRKTRTWRSSQSQQRVPFVARSITIGGCCGIC
ncbi:hypothetical protein ERJ75_000591000 [Trypanosoma vivax]|nr:hypothetical protein ERJ75_000591000 [Trypanosoma vivax]